MKPYLIVLLFVSKVCLGQQWYAEVAGGASAYNGDLTQQIFSAKRLFPGFQLNLKLSSGDFIDLNAGVGFMKVGADDKDNPSRFLKARNLSFKTNIVEFHVGIEFNLIDPDIYDEYPYLFASLGIFHFNPYTYDDNNKKTYLHPLSTEGEGLPGYGRKNYSLTQPCIPLGVGFKVKAGSRMLASWEFGYRILFTDYLDDVSKTYVSLESLGALKGPEAAELSYRKVGVPFSEEGFPRGNSKVRDWYFFTAFKLAIKINKK